MEVTEEIKYIESNFYKDLCENEIDTEILIEKYLLNGNTYIFRDNENNYFKLKKIISDKFQVSTTNVFMVGSAKLGFSISPKKLWKPLNDESDIDMAIISDKLYDIFWKQLLEFNINLIARTDRDDKLYRDFLEYFFKGWIRPDKFPFDFKYKKEWFDFFMEISYKDFDGRKITGAIYREEYFFKLYHKQNIDNLRRRING